jgi:hypothetical protein
VGPEAHSYWKHSSDEWGVHLNLRITSGLQAFRNILVCPPRKINCPVLQGQPAEFFHKKNLRIYVVLLDYITNVYQQQSLSDEPNMA